MLRTHLLVADRVVGRGPIPATPVLPDLSADVVERLLPRLAEMQRATAELLVAQAQAQRLWGLARAKEARPAPRAEAGPPVPAATGAEGEAAREGVVPLRTRGRRRG